MRLALNERLQNSAAGQWLAEQSTRDRRMLALLGGFLIALALYFGVWSPIQANRQAAQQRYAQAMDDYRWLQAHRREAKSAVATRGQVSNQGGQALLSVVAGSARRNGIELSRFQPKGNGALSIVLQEVAFDELVVWLHRLAAEHGIRVRQATIDSRQSDGRISGRIVVS